MTLEELSKNGLYLGTTTFAPTKSFEYLKENLLTGENILLITNAQLTTPIGVIAVTDKRLIFAEKSFSGKRMIDMGLKKIKTLSSASNKLIVSDGGDVLEYKLSIPQFAEKTLRKIKEAQESLETASAPAAQPAAANNVFADIEKLADLKAKGIITEEEFAAKKKALLGL